jgi:hypothetical protein
MGGPRWLGRAFLIGVRFRDDPARRKRGFELPLVYDYPVNIDRSEEYYK